MKKRVPMQSSPLFLDSLKELKRELEKIGLDKSLRDLTEELIPSIAELKKRIMKDKDEFKLRFDKRWF